MKVKQLLLVVILLAAAITSRAADSTPSSSTLLGIRVGEFTLEGKSTFLLGFSYCGALGADDAAVRRDLDDAQRLGFNWLRVWATWNAFDRNVSAVGTDGAPRELILYQEPFRRGYTRWEPLTEDFLNDLRGAIAGGAAGWCFHNGQQGNTADKQPRRSFDLRERRLFDQLDDVERQVMQQAATELKGR